MKSYKRHLYIAATFILFIMALVFSSINTGHSAPMSDRDVRVINTTTEPVPTVAQGTTAVAGDVSITNMPTVKAQQFGSWNVDITNTPTVQVGNTATNPILVRDVDNAARQPFQKGIRVTVPAGTELGIASFQVPSEKRLVIEYVSTTEISSTIGVLLVNIFTSVRASGDVVGHSFGATRIENGISDVFVISQQTRLYADPGTNVAVVCATPNSEAESKIGVTLSGHFVDVP